MFCEGELWYIIVDSACRGRIIYHTYPNKTYIYSGPSCLSPNIHLQSLKIYLHFITRMQGFRGRLAGYRLVRAWRGIAHMGIFRLQLRGSLAIFIYVLWGWAMIYNPYYLEFKTSVIEYLFTDFIVLSAITLIKVSI